METITFKGHNYPKFQSEGNAAQFAIPYAKHFCKGKGVDVGCNRPEWSFPGSILIDPAINSQYDAMNFSPESYDLDYIFSSHCLEHLQNWVSVLDYWTYKLKSGGILFLYLPDYSQEYWRPWNNKKHLNIFSPDIINDYMSDNGYKNIFKSNIDLNNAFMVVGEKI
jgi:predicted SAM-dependent methyltransferase